MIRFLPSAAGEKKSLSRDEMTQDRGLSPQMQVLARDYFWCDFNDLFPGMKWDDHQDPT